MPIILRELFDDPNLSQWTVKADTGHVVEQKSETVTRSGVTYARDFLHIDYNGSTNTGEAYAKHDFGKDLGKGCLRIVFRCSNTPPSGQRIPIANLYNATNDSGVIGISIDENGKLDVNYYIENQIIPAALRILEMFGVRKEELGSLKPSKGLAQFF